MARRDNKTLRILGMIGATFYTFLAFVAADVTLKSSVLAPPNEVFPTTDGIGMLGYLFFLGIVAGTGVLAVVFAYYMKGYFRILYFSGSLAFLAAGSFLPLSIATNSDYDPYPVVDGPEIIAGQWMCDGFHLDLRRDSTYRLDYDFRPLGGSDGSYRGTWRLEVNRIYFSHLDSTWANPWEVKEHDGFYLIRYDFPANPDAWSGNLGLMRAQEWRVTH